MNYTVPWCKEVKRGYILKHGHSRTSESKFFNQVVFHQAPIVKIKNISCHVLLSLLIVLCVGKILKQFLWEMSISNPDSDRDGKEEEFVCACWQTMSAWTK